jgi:hypothetical protein
LVELIFLALATGVLGCSVHQHSLELAGSDGSSGAGGASAGIGGSDASAPLVSTFAVSDEFSPTYFFGDAQVAGDVTMSVNAGCKPRPAGARGDCYVFSYRTATGEASPSAWVSWVFPAKGAATLPGRAVDTSKFQQVRFYAAIEGPSPLTQNGAKISLSLMVGGFGLVLGGNYEDGARSALFLTAGSDVDSTLRPFTIRLDSLALGVNCGSPQVQCAGGFASAVISAFAWQIEYPTDGDPTGQSPLKIYLDDVVWDTAAPSP